MKNNKAVNSPLDFILRNAEYRGESVALIDENGSWTWNELLSAGAGLASRLEKAGLSKGGRAAYLTRDNVEGFIILIAIWLAKGVASPLNPSQPQHLVDRMLERLDPQLVVLGRDLESVYTAGLPTVSVEELSRDETGERPKVSSEASSPALILFSSGTTGEPKGIVSTHKAIAMNSRETAKALGVESDDRILINTPHYYTSAIIHFLTLASRGGGLATWQGFLFSDTFCDVVGKYSCTGFGGAPTHFVRILSAPPAFAPKTLRFMMSSGDHLSDSLALNAERFFPGIRMFRVYGLSEVAGRLCILEPELLRRKPGSVGRPLPRMSVTVKREDGVTDALPGESGEVHVAGPMLTSEYFRDEVNSADLHTPGGFRTGDVGVLDDEGYLSILGRLDDVFKSGGEKVSCLMIQNELLSLGLFEDVAVLAVEDELLGRVPKVYYVADKDFVFNKMDLVRRLRKTLPNSHVPRLFEAVDFIPRTGSGKVIKAELAGS